MDKTRATQPAEVSTEVSVEFPKAGERVNSPEYTFRVAAKAANRVDISIDGGEWRSCRQAEGYWWYDWSGYMSGKHQAVARIEPQMDGQKFTSPTCRFRVELT